MSDQRDRLIDLGRIEPGHHLVEQQNAAARVASARAISSRRWSMVVRSLAAVCSLAARPTNSMASQRLFARRRDVAIAQESAGHDVRQHRHRAEGFCDLKGAGQAERADIVRLQPDDFAAEGQTEPESGR